MYRNPSRRILLLIFLISLTLIRGALCFQRDVKRLLASRVIRKANTAKERSLQDVLRDFRRQEAQVRVEKTEKRKRKNEKWMKIEEKSQDTERPEQEPVLRTWSEIFAWAINSTVTNRIRHHHNESQTISLTRQTKTTDIEMKAWERLASTQSSLRQGLRALPESKIHKKMITSNENKSNKGRKRRIERTFRMPFGEEETPLDVMIRAVRIIDQGQTSSIQKVNALLLIEDMCHSVDNGRDLTLHHVGGVSSIVHALSDKNERVRATASWALATCAMNNSPVQNASTSFGAVRILVHLAASDPNSVVRSRALLALNAVLEDERAQAQFRNTGIAIDMLRKALDNEEDVRAIRRALNLGELLVRTDLGLWKTEFEAWDIPQRVERMLVHKDLDVRESAARLISALDGGTLL